MCPKKAVKMVRGEMGLKNVKIMIPFVRTLDMAKDVNEVLVPWTQWWRLVSLGLDHLLCGAPFLYPCCAGFWKQTKC
jgi:hypothetical protein